MELVEELLISQGFRVITVPDGAEAMGQLPRKMLIFVILDMMCPS
jgi:DNA-binding response OmpR family regulator